MQMWKLYKTTELFKMIPQRTISLKMRWLQKQKHKISHSRENSAKTSSGTSKNSSMNERKHIAFEKVHPK